MPSPRPRQSRLVLDQPSCNALIRWLLEQNTENRVRWQGVTVQPADDHLHVTVQGLALGMVMPAFDVGLDVHLELAEDTLQVKVELRGASYAAQWLLKKLGSLDHIVLYLVPLLRHMEGVRLHGGDSLDVDLSCLRLALADGQGGCRKVRLTDLVHVDELKVGSSADEMLVMEFSLV
jgi:hypothetical protein